jgi:hypothetical protein
MTHRPGEPKPAVLGAQLPPRTLSQTVVGPGGEPAIKIEVLPIVAALHVDARLGSLDDHRSRRPWPEQGKGGGHTEARGVVAQAAREA